MSRRPFAPPHPPFAVWLVPFALWLGITPGRADPPPLTLPTRDVDVTYQVLQPGDAAPPLSQRIRWIAARRLLRVDTPSPGLYVVMDYPAHLLSAIRPARRMVLQIHSDGATLLPGASPAAGFVRRGEDTIAGLPCTDWQTRDPSGTVTIVCLTPDGVMLRAIIGQSALVLATRVTFGALEPDVFAVPADYRRVVPPGPAP